MTAKDLANRAERRCVPVGRAMGPRDGSGPRGSNRVAKISGPKGSITRISK